jgi:hypothetical protein
MISSADRVSAWAFIAAATDDGTAGTGVTKRAAVNMSPIFFFFTVFVLL